VIVGGQRVVKRKECRVVSEEEGLGNWNKSQMVKGGGREKNNCVLINSGVAPF